MCVCVCLCGMQSIKIQFIYTHIQYIYKLYSNHQQLRELIIGSSESEREKRERENMVQFKNI